MKMRLGIVRTAHNEFDWRWKKLTAEHGVIISCMKSCHACCSEPVLVAAAEARLAIESIPAAELDGVKERTRDWVDRAEASGMLKVRFPLVTDWLKAGLVCPLLKNGLCLVYQNRPLGCRAHCALNDPVLCHSTETRLQQKYAKSDDLCAIIFGHLIMTGNQIDNLGAFLARWLLGRKVESAARENIPLEVVGKGPDRDGVLTLKRTDQG